jgi:hypothetical protein
MQVVVARPSDTGRGAVLWAAAGAVIFVLAGIGALLAFALVERVLPVDAQPQAGAVSLSIRNGLHQVAWGGLAAVLSVPVGRRFVAGLRFGHAGWVVLATGFTLGGISMFLLNELDRLRNGMFDPDHVGFAFFAGPSVVAIALATWATLATPGPAARIIAGTMLLAVSALLLALFPSLSGVVDGIRAESIPLAAAFLADLVFAALAAVLVVRKVARPTS